MTPITTMTTMTALSGNRGRTGGVPDFEARVGALERASTPAGFSAMVKENRLSETEAAFIGGSVGLLGAGYSGIIAIAMSAGAIAIPPLAIVAVAAAGVAGALAGKSLWSGEWADKTALAKTIDSIAQDRLVVCSGNEPQIKPAALDAWRARRDQVCGTDGKNAAPSSGKPS